MRGIVALSLFFVFWFVPAISGATSSSAPKDTAEFLGDFVTSRKGDTLIVRYSLTLQHLNPDSITLKVSDVTSFPRVCLPFRTDQASPPDTHSVIFSASQSVPLENKWRKVRLSKGRYYLSGSVKFEVAQRSTKWMRVDVEAFQAPDTLPKVTCGHWFNSAYWGLYGNFWQPNWGYYSSRPSAGLDKEGALIGYDLGMMSGTRHGRFVLMSSWSGTGKVFTFSEPLVVRYQVVFGEPQRIAAGPFLSAKLVKIKHVEGDNRLREVKWGPEVGLGVETPFERISYSYTSAGRAYHTVELFLCGESGGTGYRVGTLFSLRRERDIWMVQMGFHIEGWDGEGTPMLRENNRPFYLKALEWSGALPVLIIYGIYKGLSNPPAESPKESR